ncbi:MAG: hypothetical protein K0U78_05990 [Actinomycetia bacterium]|nr:hypothetical protein [Actinomycetes bacterium]
MEISIEDSARKHGIEDWEIRATIEYPEYRIRLRPRRGGVQPHLFSGRIDNEPPIEVIANLADEQVWESFHAMLLRRSTALAAAMDQLAPGLFNAIVDHQRM